MDRSDTHTTPAAGADAAPKTQDLTIEQNEASAMVDQPVEIEQFRLMDFPPELWSRICHLAVTRPQTTELDVSLDDATFRAGLRLPPLTQVCRTTRYETLPAFYANPFTYVHDLHGLLDYKVYSWLRQVVLQWHHPLPNLTVQSCLGGVPSLHYRLKCWNLTMHEVDGETGQCLDAYGRIGLVFKVVARAKDGLGR